MGYARCIYEWMGVYGSDFLVAYFLAEKPETFLCLCRFTKAYDRVDRKMLRKVLSKYGVSTNLIQAISSLYEGSVACVG